MGDDQGLATGDVPRTCDAAGCGDSVYARGKCKYHYQKARREDPSSLAPTKWGRWKDKVCSTDGCEKPAYSHGRCVACANKAKYQERKETGTHYCPKKRSDAHLKMQYGITGTEYDRMYVAQGGLCAICKEPPHDGNTPPTWKVRRLAVDHCHTTGKVRALLCNSCNLLVKDRNTTELLRKAIEYLENHAG